MGQNHVVQRSEQEGKLHSHLSLDISDTFANYKINVSCKAFGSSWSWTWASDTLIKVGIYIQKDIISIATSQQYFRRNHGKPGCAISLEKIRKISDPWTDLEIFLLEMKTTFQVFEGQSSLRSRISGDKVLNHRSQGKRYE